MTTERKTMSEKEKLLQELTAVEHLYARARQQADWDTAQSEAMKMMNLTRQLELLRIQSEQEAA